ncbi:CaiB/BaiF CoA-transferase family protein [Oceanicella sp. SM1341]|uniref:CaiB/BaiF CoA transferase family protein n=1 Tax=Oceanicella sp. SM1341 TaxID=1548889 RepID=UPI000E557255|nr:CaiB/BaiF CoA-transferase family protein [Oceanicella sp. SM1341]
MPAPLQDVTIVEFRGLGPAPFAAMCLSDMGARVIQIAREQPGPPSPWLDRGRERLALDLKSDAGRARALELIGTADLLIEGFRPGRMEALGLGPEAAFAANPRLVYGRMTGWGQEGPMAGLAGHDLNFLAMSGMLSLMGYRDRPPAPPLNLVSDFGGGGMYLAFGLLCALHGARATGRGAVIDAAMVHGTNHLATFVHGRLAAGGWAPEREANALDGGAPFYRVYDCADGGWMSVAAVEPQFWRAALAALELSPELLAQQWQRESWPEQIGLLAERFRSRSRAAWIDAFEGVDACVCPVLTPAEAAAHPQVGCYFEQVGEVSRPRPAPIIVAREG